MNPLEELAVTLKGMKHEVKYRKILTTGELSKAVIWWSWKDVEPDEQGTVRRQYFILPDGYTEAHQYNKIMDGKFVEVTE